MRVPSLHLTLPLLLAALLSQAISGVLAFDAFVLGVQQKWTAHRGPNGGYLTQEWTLAAQNRNTGQVDQTGYSGASQNTRNFCGAWLFGAQVWCYGDILTPCSNYGVAAYNYRTCRTYCYDKGDRSPLFHYPGASGRAMSFDLICDRPL